MSINTVDVVGKFRMSNSLLDRKRKNSTKEKP